MGPLAQLGLRGGPLGLAANLFLLVLIATWIALIYWTRADAQRRMEDSLLIRCSTAAAALFPYIGTIIYTIVRPPEYLADARERELEIAAAEARVDQLEEPHCPYCDFQVESSFLRCPSCLRRLKEGCRTCGKPLDPRWKICPYCESELGQGGSRRRPGRAPQRADGSLAPQRGERSEGEAAPTRARATQDSEPRGTRAPGTRPASAAGARPQRTGPQRTGPPAGGERAPSTRPRPSPG